MLTPFLLPVSTNCPRSAFFRGQSIDPQIKKPAEAGSKPQLLLMFLCGMRRGGVNLARCHDETCKCFMRNECAPAINVLTLMIALFGFFAEIATRTSVSRFHTNWAMHHDFLSRLAC